jgi:hypothetical protein
MTKYSIELECNLSYGELIGGILTAEGDSLPKLISNATVGFEYGGGAGIKHVNISELKNFEELEYFIIEEYVKLAGV